MRLLNRFVWRLSSGLLLLGLAVAPPVLAEDAPSPHSGVLYEHAAPRARATVVLAHDWFGDSEYYRSFGAELARRGYGVIATDLYRGKPGGRTHAEAWALMKELTDEHASGVLVAAVAEASRRTDTVFVIGFSAGAPHAMRAAIAKADLVDGVVVFYGDLVKDAGKLAKLKGPVLAIYGSNDNTYGETLASTEVAQFLAGADAAGIGAETHVYAGAAHAFAQPLFNAGATYDAGHAAAALELTLDFLKRAADSSIDARKSGT